MLASTAHDCDNLIKRCKDAQVLLHVAVRAATLEAFLNCVPTPLQTSVDIGWRLRSVSFSNIQASGVEVSGPRSNNRRARRLLVTLQSWSADRSIPQRDTPSVLANYSPVKL